MSEISRRGLFLTIAGAGAAALLPDAAADEQLYSIEGYFKWFSTKRGFGDFVHDYFDDVTVGAFLRLKEGPAFRASLRPFSPAGEKLRHLIVPGQPVTLLGPAPFGPEAAHVEWRVSAIRCGGEVVLIPTWLEPYQNMELQLKRAATTT